MIAEVQGPTSTDGQCSRPATEPAVRSQQSSAHRAAATPVTDHQSPSDSPVVGVKELSELLGVSERAVRYQAASGKYGEAAVPGESVWTVSNLPAEVRDRLLARREAQARVAAKQQLADLEDQLRGDSRVPWTLLDLSDAERAGARARADFVLAVDRLQRERPELTIPQVVVRLESRAELETDCPYRSLLAKGKNGKSAISARNYFLWSAKWKRYRSHKRDETQWWALADRYAHNFKRREGDDRYWHHIALLYENPNQMSLVDVYHAVVAKGQKDGWGEAPTLRQVTYWYQRKANRLAVKARRQGEKYLYNTLDAPVIRDWSGIKSGDCWCSDHHLFNVFVRIPAPHAPGYWVAVRPWITQFLDVPSFHEVGRIIRAAQPNTDAVIAAWRQAVERLGWCASAIYFDNGKDYRAAGIAKMALDENRAAGVAKELSVRSIFALPFNARAKPCELDFSEIEQKFQRQWATYCGHDKAHFDMLWPILKRDRLATYGGDPNSAALAGCLVNPELVPTLEEFAAAYAKFRAEEREEKTSDGIMLNGKSPRQAWEEGLLTLERPKLSKEQVHLAFLLPSRELVSVKAGGVVRYTPPGGQARDAVHYQSDTLLPFIESKEKLMMKIDVTDMSHCYLFRWRGEDHGWQQVRCEGEYGGVPAWSTVPALTGHEQVRLATRANRARRKAIRAANNAEEVQRAIEELRRPGATDTETRLEQGIYTLRLSPESGNLESKVQGPRSNVAERDARKKRLAEIFANEVSEEDRQAYRYGAAEAAATTVEQATGNGE